MGHSSSKFARILAIVAIIGLPCSPVRADDPQEVSGIPTLPPGANLNILKRMEQEAQYQQSVALNTHLNTVQQPTSLSSCLKDILKDAEKLEDMFADMPSFSSILTAFAEQCQDELEDSLNNGVGVDMSGIAHTVQNGIIQQTSITNLMGSTGTQTTSAILAARNAANGITGSSSNGSSSNGSSSSGNYDEGYDDVDNAANSQGALLTKNSLQPSGMITDSYSKNTTTPAAELAAAKAAGITIPPAIITYDDPTKSPQNATICIPPSNRSDLDYAAFTLNTDAVSDLIAAAAASLNPAPGAGGAKTDTAVLPPNTTDLPQGKSTTANGTNSSTTGGPPSQNPAAVDGQPKCSTGTKSSSNPGFTSTAMPCTADTKTSCNAGSGCSSENGSIGTAKTYQSGHIVANGIFGTGQCAELTKAEVPNVGFTGDWRRGKLVYGDAQLQFGTPVATFFGPAPTSTDTDSSVAKGHAYRYEPGGRTGGVHLDGTKCSAAEMAVKPHPACDVHQQHTGIYMGQTPTDMFLFNQYSRAKAPFLLVMPFNTSAGPWQPGGAAPTKNDEMHNAMNYHVICTTSASGCPQQ